MNTNKVLKILSKGDYVLVWPHNDDPWVGLVSNTGPLRLARRVGVNSVAEVSVDPLPPGMELKRGRPWHPTMFPSIGDGFLWSSMTDRLYYFKRQTGLISPLDGTTHPMHYSGRNFRDHWFFYESDDAEEANTLSIPDPRPAPSTKNTSTGDRWNVDCQRCGAPAYLGIGFWPVECSRGCK